MDGESDKIKLLSICVEELRRVYDDITVTLEHLRTKALALLAGEVALITFLFSPEDQQQTWGGFLKADPPLYGLVLFGLGLILLLLAFIMFLSVISTAGRNHPPEEKDIANIYERFNSSSLEFLEYLKSEYMLCIPGCIRTLDVRATRFMIGVYALAIGLTIIILLKYLAGRV